MEVIGFAILAIILWFCMTFFWARFFGYLILAVGSIGGLWFGIVWVANKSIQTGEYGIALVQVGLGVFMSLFYVPIYGHFKRWLLYERKYGGGIIKPWNERC